MKQILFFSFLLMLVACSEPAVTVVKPTDKQIAWAESEVGVLIHFDMPVYSNNYNWRNFGTHPDASVFNPTALDTDQWLEAAKKIDAKYAVLVAKHCSGFSLWPTEAHEYSVKYSKWKDGKGDIVADFIASCKKYGIKPGIYASTTANGYLHVDNPGIVQESATITQEEYNKIVDQQLNELWSNYGELFEIWFDGGVLSKEDGGANVLELVEKLQPGAVAFQGPYGHPNLVRWVGNEEGVAPEPCWSTADSTTQSSGTVVIQGLHGNPEGPFWCPGEADFTLRWNNSFQGGWFWKAGEDHKIFNVNQLMKKYETSVGRNTNMLVGLVVNDKGLVPQSDVKRLEEWGNAIKAHYATPYQTTQGRGEELVMNFEKPVEIDRLIIQEDIAYGERILAYRIEGYQGTEWVTLTHGQSVGHKRIATFAPKEISAIRFISEKSKTEPVIKQFSVYVTKN